MKATRIGIVFAATALTACGLGSLPGASEKSEKNDTSGVGGDGAPVIVQGFVADDGMALTSVTAALEVVRPNAAGLARAAAAQDIPVLDGTFEAEVEQGVPHLVASGERRGVVPPARKSQGDGAQLAFVVNAESTDTAAIFESMLGSEDSASLVKDELFDFPGLFEIGAALSSAKSQGGGEDAAALVQDLAATFLQKNKETVQSLVESGVSPAVIAQTLKSAKAEALAPTAVAEAVQSGTFSQTMVARNAKKAAAASAPEVKLDLAAGVAADVATKGTGGLAFAQAHVVQTKLAEIVEAAGGSAEARASMREALWSKVKTMTADDVKGAISQPATGASELDKLADALAKTGGDVAKVQQTIAASGACKDIASIQKGLTTEAACKQAGARWATSQAQDCKVDDVTKEKVCSGPLKTQAYCDTAAAYDTPSKCHSFCYAKWHAWTSGQAESGGSDGAAPEGGTSEPSDKAAGASLAIQSGGYCKFGGGDAASSEQAKPQDGPGGVSDGEGMSDDDSGESPTPSDASVLETKNKCSTLTPSEALKYVSCMRDDASRTCKAQYGEIWGTQNWFEKEAYCYMKR